MSCGPQRLTPAGLLSGTPKKQQAKGAKGGLLRQIGDFGILVFKDFGSILSMHPETKAETLAALREVYDGSWTRHLGSDGGRTLHWQGKVGLITAATGVIDSHYAVIGAMGDRFLFSRLAPTQGQAQFNRALDHVGDATKRMRAELAEAVARLFAGRKKEPRPISNDEVKRIGDAISLVVRLRGAVERDRREPRGRGDLWRRGHRPHRARPGAAARRPRYARGRARAGDGGRPIGRAGLGSAVAPRRLRTRRASTRPSRPPTWPPRSGCRPTPPAASSKTWPPMASSPANRRAKARPISGTAPIGRPRNDRDVGPINAKETSVSAKYNNEWREENS